MAGRETSLVVFELFPDLFTERRKKKKRKKKKTESKYIQGY